MDDWTIGQRVAVMDDVETDRVVYRGRVVRLTATQVLVAHEHDVDGNDPARFRRHGLRAGTLIDPAYYRRRIRPLDEEGK